MGCNDFSGRRRAACARFSRVYPGAKGFCPARVAALAQRLKPGKKAQQASYCKGAKGVGDSHGNGTFRMRSAAISAELGENNTELE